MFFNLSPNFFRCRDHTSFGSQVGDVMCLLGLKVGLISWTAKTPTTVSPQTVNNNITKMMKLTCFCCFIPIQFEFGCFDNIHLFSGSLRSVKHFTSNFNLEILWAIQHNQHHKTSLQILDGLTGSSVHSCPLQHEIQSFNSKVISAIMMSKFYFVLHCGPWPNSPIC